MLLRSVGACPRLKTARMPSSAAESWVRHRRDECDEHAASREQDKRALACSPANRVEDNVNISGMVFEPVLLVIDNHIRT
jgi:hypothetical protein